MSPSPRPRLSTSPNSMAAAAVTSAALSLKAAQRLGSMEREDDSLLMQALPRKKSHRRTASASPAIQTLSKEPRIAFPPPSDVPCTQKSRADRSDLGSNDTKGSQDDGCMDEADNDDDRSNCNHNENDNENYNESDRDEQDDDNNSGEHDMDDYNNHHESGNCYDDRGYCIEDLGDANAASCGNGVLACCCRNQLQGPLIRASHLAVEWNDEFFGHPHHKSSRSSNGRYGTREIHVHEIILD